MQPDLLDILRHRELPVSSEQLVAYLTGTLGAEESHEVERRLAAADLGQDAWEGLQMLKHSSRLPGIELALNEQLKHQLATAKPKRRRPMVFQWSLLILLVALIIVLCLGAWFLVHTLQKP
jgi:ferric-dicitrate binding protein FerR (iron transport regulator)